MKRKIEHSYTVLGDLSNALYTFIPIGVVAITSVYFTRNENLVAPIALSYAGLAVVVILYAIWQRISMFKYLGKRRARMAELAATGSYTYYSQYQSYAAATHDSKPLKTTLTNISLVEKPNAIDFLASPSWVYFDFSYSKYRHAKYSEYKSADVFYGVMEMPLARTMPNVFFDSKKARHRQFRFVFQHKQIHHLEGDFDKFFTTYFPQNYEIDTMSFITPDVMQALKAAADYDVEIIGDTLFMYGPILELDSQLAEMSSKLQAIKNALAITTANYHDDRLPEAVGWHQVTTEGSFLKRSRFWTYVNIGFVVLYVSIRIIIQLAASK